MARILQLKDLRSPAPVETIVFDDCVSAFSRAKNVSCSVARGNWKVKVLHHTLWRVKGVFKEARPFQGALENGILSTTFRVEHESEVLECSLNHLISEVSFFERSELFSCHHFYETEGLIKVTFIFVPVVHIVLNFIIHQIARHIYIFQII